MAAQTTVQRNIFRRIALFWSETMQELRKASWPDWPELKNSTVLVILTVLILGTLVAVADFCFLQFVKVVTHFASGA